MAKLARAAMSPAALVRIDIWSGIASDPVEIIVIFAKGAAVFDGAASVGSGQQIQAKVAPPAPLTTGRGTVLTLEKIIDRAER